MQALDLSHNAQLTDESLRFVTKSCPRLRQLVLRACVLLTNKSMLSISRALPSLVELDVGAIGAVSDGVLATLVQRCTLLTKLTLTLSNDVTRHGGKALTKIRFGLNIRFV